MKEELVPKVSVCVIVYNHSSYILECLKSIAAQQCSFPFEVVIRDDASQDGSGNIIADYISKNQLCNFTLYRVEKNEGMMLNISNALKLCRGDYIAFCEGDDYWTDDFKLEKQTSLMENNPDCALSMHPCYLHRSMFNKKNVGFFKGNQVKRFGISDVLKNAGQSSPSASYMIIRDIINILPPWFCSAPVADLFIEMYSLKLGFGLYMPDVMCAYRIVSQNSWSDMMRRKGGYKLINHGAEMHKCIHHMENESAFRGFDFNILKSTSSLVVAVGHLLEKDFDKFKESISESYAIYPDSSPTQKWLYRLKNVPGLALFLYNSKKLLER